VLQELRARVSPPPDAFHLPSGKVRAVNSTGFTEVQQAQSTDDIHTDDLGLVVFAALDNKSFHK
jgi:hypothetical protein